MLPEGCERDIKRALRAASFTTRGPDVAGLFRRQRRGEDLGDALSFAEFARVIRTQGTCSTTKASDKQVRGLYEELPRTETEEKRTVVWDELLGRVRLVPETNCLDADSLAWLLKWTGGFVSQD